MGLSACSCAMAWGPLRAPAPPSAGAGFSDADAAKRAGHAQCALERPRPVLVWVLQILHDIYISVYHFLTFIGLVVLWINIEI